MLFNDAQNLFHGKSGQASADSRPASRSCPGHCIYRNSLWSDFVSSHILSNWASICSSTAPWMPILSDHGTRSELSPVSGLYPTERHCGFRVGGSPFINPRWRLPSTPKAPLLDDVSSLLRHVTSGESLSKLLHRFSGLRIGTSIARTFASGRSESRLTGRHIAIFGTGRVIWAAYHVWTQPKAVVVMKCEELQRDCAAHLVAVMGVTILPAVVDPMALMMPWEPDVIIYLHRPKRRHAILQWFAALGFSPDSRG